MPCRCSLVARRRVGHAERIFYGGQGRPWLADGDCALPVHQTVPARPQGASTAARQPLPPAGRLNFVYEVLGAILPAEGTPEKNMDETDF